MNQTLREKFENFSSLSDDECAFIITNHLIEAIESDVYVDWEIVSKFMTVSYPLREDLCKLFNLAIKKNQQKIGNITVGEWIKRYLDKFAYKERTPNTFFDFVKNSEETQSLPKNDKIKLMRVLRIYDYLLVVPILDLEGPVSSILRFPMWLDSQAQNTAATTPKEVVPSEPKLVMENISISEALKQYPEIGDQIITLDHIKIRNFDSPVRPSIKNWLSDYVTNLGYESHNSMMRGNYLFQNENAKILNYQDRQRLSQILKSFDEKIPLTVDVNAKQIVFSSKNIQSEGIQKNAALKTESSKQSLEAPNRNNFNVPETLKKPFNQDEKPKYQPKIQEPGDNFEKVIGFEEKKSESVFPNISKIVNLKEVEKEKATAAKPFVKNLVNIKELLDTNKKEEGEKTPSKTSFTSQKEKERPFIKRAGSPSSFAPSQSDPFSLSVANNSISHADPFASQKHSWINNTIDPLDKTERKLFESNNQLLDRNKIKNQEYNIFSNNKITEKKESVSSNIRFTQTPNPSLSSDVLSGSKLRNNSNYNEQSLIKGFSSPQELPHEKNQGETQEKSKEPEKTQASQISKMQPYRIRPASFEDN